jgi:hypothetical protein
MSTMIRVSDKTHATLRSLADQQHVAMNEVVEEAIELYRRQQWLAALNAGYAEPMSAQEQAEWDAEMGLLDTTVGDGLESEA